MTIWIPKIEKSGLPLYQAIAGALAVDIHAGKLRSGDRLPPQRELADELGVTVGTITRAYCEAQRRGLVSGEVGRGTFVTGDSPKQNSQFLPGQICSDRIELGMSIPLSNNHPDLAALLMKLSKEPSLGELLQYQPAAGILRHRIAGAEWMKLCGIEISEEDVVICAGAHQAITVVLLTIAKPGETLLVEELTYPGIKSLAALLDLRLAPVAIDSEGLIPDSLDKVSQCCKARILYSIPTLHNPTTRTMSIERRKDIAEVIRRRRLLLIEDDSFALLSTVLIPPLSCELRDCSYYIASTSKLLAGGLRVAFLAAPVGQKERLSAAVASTCWMTSPLSVEVTARWIEDGTVAMVAQARRSEAAARQELAGSILAGQRYESTMYSYHLWLELPEPWRSENFLTAAYHRGVTVTDSSLFTVGRNGSPPFVRVSLTAVSDRHQLVKGLEIISSLLRNGPSLGPAIV